MRVKKGEEHFKVGRLSGKPRDRHKQRAKTYNSRDSLVVTHPTTNRPSCGLSTAERTGSPVFHTLWSYVTIWVMKVILYHPFSNFSSIPPFSFSFPFLPCYHKMMLQLIS